MNGNQVGDKAVMDQAALVSYVDDLIRDRKDPNINEQNINQVKAALLQEVNNEINLQTIKLLKEEDQIKLDQTLDKNPSDDELNKFFLERIPNLAEEIAAVLLNFRAAYLLPLQKVQEISQNSSSSASTVPPPPPPAPVAE